MNLLRNKTTEELAATLVATTNGHEKTFGTPLPLNTVKEAIEAELASRSKAFLADFAKSLKTSDLKSLLAAVTGQEGKVVAVATPKASEANRGRSKKA